MTDVASRFRKDEKILSIFAKGEPPPLVGGRRAYVGGVFFAGSERRDSDPEAYEYNEAITSFLGRWEAHIREMLEGGFGTRKARENKELMERWRRKTEKLLQASIDFFKGKNVKLPESVRFTPLPLRKRKGDVPLGEDTSRFNVYYARLTEGEGDVSLYYLDLNLARRIEDARSKFESGELNATQYLEELGKLRREVELELIERILECEDLDEEVREFFETLRELGNLAVRENDILAQLLFKRLFRIEISFHVGLSQEEAFRVELALDEEGGKEESADGEKSVWLSHKPLIHRLGYGDTKLSYEEVLLRILEEAAKKSELLREHKEELEEELEELGVAEWLKKLYEDASFLRKLRRELGRTILGGKVRGVKKVSFVRDGRAVYRVKKRIHADTYGLFLLYENGLRDKAIKLMRAFREEKEYGRRKRFVNPKLMEREVRGIEMEFLFPFWEELKRCSSFQGEKAHKALAFLLQMAGFFKAIRSWGAERGTKYMVLALLDVSGEEDFYPLWNVVRALADHLLAYPFQTLTRRSIDAITRVDNNAVYFHKNALISALRSDRKVTLELEGFEVHKPVTYSLLVEDRTVEIAGEGRHYLYTLYRFSFERNTLTIERDDRKFFVLAGGIGDKGELDRFLEETPNLVALVQDANSPILRHGKGHDSFYPVLYRSIKTPVPLTEGRKGRDKNAFVIFEKEFRKGLRYVGWLGNQQESLFKDYTLFAIRAPFVIPQKLCDEPHVSTELSLFFVGNLKGDNPEVEERVLLTLLGWLVWGSESFAFLYAKPKFIPLKLPKVVARRKNRDYVIPFGTSIFELAYLIKREEEKVKD